MNVTDKCDHCFGQGVVDDRGFALRGQPYFDTKPCPACTKNERLPYVAPTLTTLEADEVLAREMNKLVDQRDGARRERDEAEARHDEWLKGVNEEQLRLGANLVQYCRNLTAVQARCTELFEEVRALKAERESWREIAESWRKPCNEWQSWAEMLLSDLGRQPIGGRVGDGPARDVIEALALKAPGVPRCEQCGCFATRHEVDDGERLICIDCDCLRYEGATSLGEVTP